MKGLNTMFFKELFEKMLALADDGKNLDLLQYSTGGDDAEKASCERERLMLKRLQDRNHHYRQKIKEALYRLDKGNFGECNDCGCEIDEKRLIARPMTTLCITCKEEQESDEVQTNWGNRELKHKKALAQDHVFMNAV